MENHLHKIKDSNLENIVYQFYLKNMSIKEIIEKTNLSEVYIKQIIDYITTI